MLALPALPTAIIVILGDCDAEDVKDFFVDPNLISIANRLLSKSPKTEEAEAEEEEAEGEEHNRLLHHQEIFKNQQRIGNKPTLTNSRCLKITTKSLIQHCERSELRLHFEWTKVN